MIAPLGALLLVFNGVMSKWVLHERFGRRDLVATFFILGGCLDVVLTRWLALCFVSTITINDFLPGSPKTAPAAFTAHEFFDCIVQSTYVGWQLASRTRCGGLVAHVQ